MVLKSLEDFLGFSLASLKPIKAKVGIFLEYLAAAVSKNAYTTSKHKPVVVKMQCFVDCLSLVKARLTLIRSNNG